MSTIIRYTFKAPVVGHSGGNHFTITHRVHEGYSVAGDISLCNRAFRSIHRQPPNKHGNFYGRIKAGYAACRELIEKHSFTEVERSLVSGVTVINMETEVSL